MYKMVTTLDDRELLSFSGQSYKGSMIVNYSFRVLIWDILQSVMTLPTRVVIYNCKVFMRLTTAKAMNGLYYFH